MKEEYRLLPVGFTDSEIALLQQLAQSETEQNLAESEWVKSMIADKALIACALAASEWQS